MKKYNLYIILFICTLSSCSDFLEESSQDLMIPRSVKDYKELFFGEVMKTNEKDIPHPYLEYMTDDVKDQCYYGTRPQVISNDFREYVWAYYTWQGNPEVGSSNPYKTGDETLIWTITKSGDNYTISQGENYLSWESGNSATTSTTPYELVITKNKSEGTYQIVIRLIID